MSFNEFKQYSSKEGELFKIIFLSLFTSFIIIGILYFMNWAGIFKRFINYKEILKEWK